MWIWIVSLIVLIVCFIIVWRLFISSYNSVSSEKNINLFQPFNPRGSAFPLDTIRALQSKLKSLEDKSDYYSDQIEQLNRRLKNYEKDRLPSFVPKTGEMSIVKGKEGEEDWKELFYEENEKKEKLENELDLAQQEIEYLQGELKKLTSDIAGKEELEKAYSMLLQSMESAQKNLEELRNQLAENEKHRTALEEKLWSEIDQRNELENITESFATLQEENKQLQKQLSDASASQPDTSNKTSYVDELENRVSVLRIDISHLQQNLTESNDRYLNLEQQLQKEIQLRHQFEEIAQSIDVYKNENQHLIQRVKEWENRQSEFQAKDSYIQDLENKLSGLQNGIIQLQQNLTEANEKRGLLELELQRETHLRTQYQEAVSSLQVLKNENEGLRRQITELTAKQSEIEGRLLQMKDLENKVNIFEQEKSKMIANLELIINQTKEQKS